MLLCNYHINVGNEQNNVINVNNETNNLNSDIDNSELDLAGNLCLPTISSQDSEIP